MIGVERLSERTMRPGTCVALVKISWETPASSPLPPHWVDRVLWSTPDSSPWNGMANEQSVLLMGTPPSQPVAPPKGSTKAWSSRASASELLGFHGAASVTMGGPPEDDEEDEVGSGP